MVLAVLLVAIAAMGVGLGFASGAVPFPFFPVAGTITITDSGYPPSGCTLVASNPYGSLYVSTDAKAGDPICLSASLNDSPEVYLEVTTLKGAVVHSPVACMAALPPPRAGVPPPTGSSCTAYWNTSNATKPGTYRLIAGADSSAPIDLTANFTIAAR